jgi:ABC-type lipoprotein release transport system permease subunit
LNVLESIASGLASIRSHKLRSSLTLFGIVVGVAAVVAMTSFVGGIAGRIWEDFDKLGLDNVLFVGNMRPVNPEGYAYLKASKGLSFEDTEILRAEVDEILGITPVVADYKVVRAGSEARRAEIFAATPDGFYLLKFMLGQGRFLSDMDVERNARVAVLGEIVKEDLFGEANAVGEDILIGDEHFKVVGVLRQKDFSEMFGASGQEEEHQRVYIPITAGMYYISGTKRIAYFAVRLKSDADLATGYDKIHKTLLREHRQVEDFQIENVAEEILRARQQVGQIVSVWNGILSTIATVSLLVGGIGLLSVLIISVNERGRGGPRHLPAVPDRVRDNQRLRRPRRHRAWRRSHEAHDVRRAADGPGHLHPSLRRRHPAGSVVRHRRRNPVRPLPRHQGLEAGPDRGDIQIRVVRELALRGTVARNGKVHRCSRR